MEIASSNPLSIHFSFDPKSFLRQIAEVLMREFRAPPEHGALRIAQSQSMPADEPGLAGGALPTHARPARRSNGYAPRWG
jgi:hypothetical protein